MKPAETGLRAIKPRIEQAGGNLMRCLSTKQRFGPDGDAAELGFLSWL